MGAMPSAGWFPLVALCLALGAGCAPRYQNVVERPLPSRDDLTCPGYLVWNGAPVRDVFLVVNGSGIGSSAFVHPTFKTLIATGPVAYATFDKPGIRAPFDDPAAVRRDDATLARYTLGHGVACASEALRWAHERFGPAVRLHLRGHSEGSLIALYTYEALLDRDPALASRIETLVLSGLALEPFADILEHQLASMPEGGRVRQELASCNWPALEKRLGVSCAYIEDATRRPSGRAMFERLAARSAAARFYIFHGTSDWNTPVAPVRAVEAWNASTGHLRMAFHYYEGGHAGSDEARAEVARLLESLASE
jgi:pimeloyl-ACP methyl ester carboxylesterase